MSVTWRRGAAVCALLALTFATTACRGDSNDNASKRTTTTGLAATTTSTSPSSAQVLGESLDATTTTSNVKATTTTAAPNGATTTVVTVRQGAYVSDAPRDAHTENSDNSGTLTYSASPTASSSNTPKDNDPLEFAVACHVAADGHGECNVHLVNHVTRTAQFPGGLKITVTMTRDGKPPVQFVFDPGNVPSLEPGASAEVVGTIDLFEQGTYNYAATTTVAWP